MTTTENKTLEDLAATVQLANLNADPSLAWDKQSDWQRKANGYRLQLRYQGRAFTFDFWRGVGCEDAPTAHGCLECLLSDSDASGQDFEDWAWGLGYDTDSRKAYAIYQACLRIGRNMRRLLGDDFETFMYADR